MRRCHRGAIFLEVCVAILVLAAALLAAGQLLAVVAQQRRALDERLLAHGEAANLMEHIMARPWTELTAEHAASLQLSEQAARRLPHGRLRINVTTDDQAPAAKQVIVQIDWLDRGSQRVQPVQLVAWKYSLTDRASP